MSLTKLLRAPINLFKKDVITFLTVRRYDLGIINDELQYIATKPTASINTVRRKVWHLLELPDYCDEIIVLKTSHDVEIPLTELRRGNSPQHPYILEVWLPDGQAREASATIFNMLTTGKSDSSANNASNESICEKKDSSEKIAQRSTFAKHTTSTETIAQIKHIVSNNIKYPKAKNLLELPRKFSKTSLFNIGGRRYENFASILMKIQSELTVLNTKIAVLENKLIN